MAIQTKNQELLQQKYYRGQESFNSSTSNVRYQFLSTDASRLYHMHNRFKGVNFDQPPEYNLDSWLNPKSPLYTQTLHDAIFYYRPRTEQLERLRVCIQTGEMKTAAWQYAHDGQLILDGTFGISDTRLLLFIAMGIDEKGKGVPLAFFIFSAPTGNQATHAGYDSAILTEVLQAWVNSLGERNGKLFCPTLVITDTDTKERVALHIVWPKALLLLCRFHVRSCWTNKRKGLIKLGPGPDKFDFHKFQVKSHLYNLEER
ncbi:MAG TPA: hypothetical protein VGO47_13070 [Chlamydiales bacterium]|nr:hypothetical protein [Chlamydiales bacterium]